MTTLQQALVNVGIADKKNNQQYKQLDKKTKLLRTLIRETKGKVPSNVLKQIVESVDLSKFWDIVVCETVQQFEGYAVYTKHGFEHSWAGKKYTKSTPTVIHGDCETGRDFHMGYSNNSKMCDPTIEKENCWFSTDKPQVLSVEIEEYNGYNRSDSETNYEYKLVFFLPNTPYIIEPELVEILKLLKD